MQAVIVSFDSLAANAVGCYGNDWVETPNWDRLAANGVVFDHHYADVVGPLAGMAWPTGSHSSSLRDPVQPSELSSCLKANGTVTQLVTAVEHLAWQNHFSFDETTIVRGRDGLDAQPDEVPFARVVKAGLAAWNKPSFLNRSRLLWLHSPGLGLPPTGFDSLYFEDFEEKGQKIAELSEEDRLRHPAVYGGAVSLLDHWLGALLAEIGVATQPTLIVVMAAQGYLWQQIPWFKTNESQQSRSILIDQRIRAPLTIHVANDDRFAEIKSLRSARLVQTVDLATTLLDWFGLTPAPKKLQETGQSWLRECLEEVPARKVLRIGDGDGNDAIRTDQWLCLREKSGHANRDPANAASTQVVSLFAKPEDIWDVNDVSLQQPEIVSELLRQLS